ncbi:2-C-methyl-D-erythritol 2,4-cyclodiphosphate synthase [Spiroplasma endosymbiont of Aspidapion aeneum]|uniref:2-C-methyl-D-erythritol 2,4-cyclodiphosphate synthase n=1 Tax=Spiroplasma endosymbiont of Aspidapion aeneum TaxID=3066276 RepID=UPI00313C5456
MRIGFSKDIHNKVEGKKIVLGGIVIESNFAVNAYSDGDVLIHSICEALLGAMGLDDLGSYFSKDNQIENFSSIKIVDFTKNILKEKRFKITNIDTLIMVDSLIIKNYKESLKRGISDLFGIEEKKIAIKATTSENNFVDFIECSSVVLIEEV